MYKIAILMLYFLLRIFTLPCSNPPQRFDAHYSAWRQIFNLRSTLAFINAFVF